MQSRSYDFQAALIALKEKENSKWRHLMEDGGDQPYPVLVGTTAESFRNEVPQSANPTAAPNASVARRQRKTRT